MILELISLLLACVVLYLVSWLVCIAMWRSHTIVRQPSPANDTQVANGAHAAPRGPISGQPQLEPEHWIAGRLAG